MKTNSMSCNHSNETRFRGLFDETSTCFHQVVTRWALQMSHQVRDRMTSTTFISFALDWPQYFQHFVGLLNSDQKELTGFFMIFGVNEYFLCVIINVFDNKSFDLCCLIIMPHFLVLSVIQRNQLQNYSKTDDVMKNLIRDKTLFGLATHQTTFCGKKTGWLYQASFDGCQKFPGVVKNKAHTYNKPLPIFDAVREVAVT